MKKMIVCALLASLVLSCSACKDNAGQQTNQGDSEKQEGILNTDDPADKAEGNDDSVSESEGQKVTYGKLDKDDIGALHFATDKCFVYTDDSIFASCGLADYEGNILAKAKYTNADIVGDSIVLWQSKEMVIYNFDGNLLYTAVPAEGEEGFSYNMDASELYYSLESEVEENISTLYNIDGQKICTFNGILRTYPNEDGFFLATTNKSKTNAVIDLQGNELKFITSDGIGIESFKIHQEGDVYGGAFLFGTKYARFDEITLENGETMNEISGIINVATKTVTLCEKNIRLYDYNNEYVIAVVKDDDGNKTYGLYKDGFGELILNLSTHETLGEYELHDAKFFSREKGYILLSLTTKYMDDHYAIIDTQGNIIVNTTDGYVPFSSTKSDYLYDDKYYKFSTEEGDGIVGLDGNIVIPCGQYQSKNISNFINGHAVVNENSIIDIMGNVVYSIVE